MPIENKMRCPLYLGQAPFFPTRYAQDMIMVGFSKCNIQYTQDIIMVGPWLDIAIVIYVQYSHDIIMVGSGLDIAIVIPKIFNIQYAQNMIMVGCSKYNIQYTQDIIIVGPWLAIAIVTFNTHTILSWLDTWLDM